MFMLGPYERTVGQVSRTWSNRAGAVDLYDRIGSHVPEQALRCKGALLLPGFFDGAVPGSGNSHLVCHRACIVCFLPAWCRSVQRFFSGMLSRQG